MIQRNPSAGSGDPVEPTHSRAPRSGVSARLPTAHDERRRRAEPGDADIGRQLPQPRQRWVGRIAVEQHDGGAGQQPRHEVVPHHPAGGGEPEEALARTEVVVQPHHLEVLGDDPAVAVHDRLGQPRGARAVEHVQRVVGGDGSEGQVTVRGGHQLVPRVHGDTPAERRPGDGVTVRHVHHVGHGAERGHHLRHLRAAVDVSGAVPVAVDRHQHVRLDLPEAVDHGAHAELRRAARPHGAQRRRGEERHERLGDVRGIRHDAHARPDAEAAQPGGAPAHQVGELRPRKLDAARGSGSRRRRRRRRPSRPPGRAPGRRS